MKNYEQAERLSLNLKPKTITEARESREQDPDLFYKARSENSGVFVAERHRCFIQLFQEPVNSGLLTATAIKTKTAAREAKDQEESLNAISSRTSTRAREETDQDEGSKSYHAIPKF